MRKTKVTLGIDQLKWLKEYMSINLDNWRLILINNHPEWLYVGEYRPEPNEVYKRQNNLETNRYYY